jgi:hypothetical protein
MAIVLTAAALLLWHRLSLKYTGWSKAPICVVRLLNDINGSSNTRNDSAS